MASVHDGHRERLRDLYRKHGVDGFPDHQLLELLLSYAIPRRETNTLAHELLNRFGSLENVFRADINQLQLVDGVGENAATFLKIQNDMLQLIQRRRLEDKQGRIKIKSPFESAKLAVLIMANEPYETVYLILLNKDQVVQRTVCVTNGSLVEAPIYPRLIVEQAILQRAHSVILVHNHPSGNVTPSAEDRTATHAVSAALTSIDVPLLDHLIVGGQFVYSHSADAVMIVQPGSDQPIAMPLDEYQAQFVNAPPQSVKISEYFAWR